MLPSEQSGGRGTHTYQVQLGPDLMEARIQLDGRDLGAAAVRRVYPDAGAASVGRSPSSASQGRQGQPTAYSRYVNTRLSPAASRSAADPLLSTHPAFLNPNGAPIID